MGFRSAAALIERVERVESRGDVGIRSPFAGPLSPVVLADLVSLYETVAADLPLSRELAMSIPGVYRARAILLSLIPDKPLQAWRGDVAVPPAESPFLYRTPGILGPWQRMARTVDDLIFYPYSLWLTQRGDAVEGRRPILNAVHCPYESWRINEAGLIELENADLAWEVADEDDVILIPGPSEGLLAYASRTLRGAAALESTWVTRAGNPSPITELHITEDSRLEEDEVEELRDNWVVARNSANGAVAVTPIGVEVRDHGAADASLFIEGRNGVRLDVAAFFNLPGSVLDATTATASLTYVTQEGNRTSIYDLTLPYWVRPIESRLSQDDVVPHGQSVRFDFSSLTAATPTPIVTED